jgi:hypothetical protein
VTIWQLVPGFAIGDNVMAQPGLGGQDIAKLRPPWAPDSITSTRSE